MKKLHFKYYFLSFFIAFALSGLSFSQSLRNSVNDGVDQYEKGKYSDAEAMFKKELKKNPKIFRLILT